MDKNQASNVIVNAGMSNYDVAHSIYQATVRGISGANQNDGYGFALSAIAELWNIRGTIENPMARTKITGRYKNMAVDEDMILQVVEEYPDGIDGEYPLFDELLGVADGWGNDSMSDRYAQSSQWQDNSRSQRSTRRSSSGSGGNEDAEDRAAGVVFILALVVTKFVLHMGWIPAVIVSFVLAAIAMVLVSRRR